MPFPTVKIHLGANINDVTVDGKTFDRFHMTKQERHRFNHLFTDAWRTIYGQEVRGRTTPR